MPRKQTRPKRKVLARYGRYGSTVLVSSLGPRVMVTWRDTEGRRMASFRGDDAEQEGREYAERLVREDRTEKVPPVTMEGVWKRFKASPRYTRGLSERTKELYASAWTLWLLVNQGTAPAEQVDATTFEETRTKLEVLTSKRKTAYSTNTIKSCLQVIKSILSWAATSGLIAHNAAIYFRFILNKHTRPKSPDEYTRKEFDRILKHLPAHGVTRSRSRDAILLLGYQGVRASAAVHLRWEDIKWKQQTCTWQEQWDKTGKSWEQTMHTMTLSMLRDRWEAQGRPESGWVFSGRHPTNPYTIQSLWDALMIAETAAKVPHKPYRALHGFRRMVAGDVREATGSLDDAMAAIGKASPSSYVKSRPATSTRGIREIVSFSSEAVMAAAEDQEPSRDATP